MPLSAEDAPGGRRTRRRTLRSQRGAALVAELFGMQFDGQAQGCGGVEHAAGLGRAEADVLAEGVHGVDQPQRMQPGIHAQTASM
jgi:hypothetical protein